MRAALVVEQLYNPVPGGIGAFVGAVAKRLPALAESTGDELVGVSAFHRDRLTLDMPLLPMALPSRLLQASWQFLRWPGLRRPRPDVVLAPSLLVPPKRGAGLAVYIADVTFLRMPRAFTRWGLSFHKAGLRNAVRSADRIMVPSRATAEDVVDFCGVPADRVTVIPLGVEAPGMTAADAGARRDRLGIRQPYFLFVGTREPRKNLSGVLAAAAQLRDLPHGWMLVGPEGWRTSVEAEVAKGQLEETVRVVGRLGDLDLAAMYEGAEALCYPSFYEGFGLPVLEAMAHGVPVVTSHVSSLPEVAGEAALLVDPNDPSAIAAALRRVAGDSALRASLAMRGRARARRFSWDACAAAVWDVVRSVGGGG